MNPDFKILPFNFKRLPNKKMLLVNQGGEFDFISSDEFNDLLNLNLVEKSAPYIRLKSKGFIADNNLDTALNLIATQLRSRKSFLLDFTSLHMMVLTARCNYKCDYCHASSAGLDKTELDMTWDTAKKSVDLIFQSPSPIVKIEFQGGEPLLNWDVLIKVVKYAQEKNIKEKKNLEFVICTNLSLLDEEKIKFLYNNKVMISTSLDGPEELQNHHRKPRTEISNGYLQWQEKFDLLKEKWPGYVPSVLLTITKTNLPKLREVIDTYLSFNVDGIFLRALNPYGFAKSNSSYLGYTTKEFFEAYKDALAYLIKVNLKGYFFPEYYTTLLLQRILTPFSTGFVDLQSPSGAAISGSIYDYNGEIYPSDEGRMLARMGDKKFLMGNVHEHFYSEIWSSKITSDIVNSSCLEIVPGCASCVYQVYCGSDPIRNYLETGDLIGKRPNPTCEKNQLILNYLFELIEANNSDVMDVFWSWITQRPLSKIRGEEI